MTSVRPIVDLTFPHPLMEPAKWSGPKEGRSDLWVLPLEWTVLRGGPWRRYAERVQETGAYAWRLSSGWDRLEYDLVLREEVRSRLLSDAKEPEWIFVDSDLNDQDLKLRWTELWGTDLSGVSLAASSAFLRSGVLLWGQEIFPGLRASVGEDKFAELVNAFGKEWGEADRLPWDGLRYFPAFLRKHATANEAIAERAGLDWARFEALFSPQDESREWTSLARGEVLLNPTAQLVRLRSPEDGAQKGMAQARAVFRDPYGGDCVCEKLIGWREAVLLDELLEAPRVTAKELLSHADHQYQASDRRLVAFSPQGSFAESLEGLVKIGLILRAQDA